MAEHPTTTATSDTAGRDWPKQATDTIVRYVDLVRDNTTTRALKAARVVVYGVVAGFAAFVALILAVIGTFRLVDGKLPGQTWSTYLLFGGLFFVSGALVFSRRRAAMPKAAA